MDPVRDFNHSAHTGGIRDTAEASGPGAAGAHQGPAQAELPGTTSLNAAYFKRGPPAASSPRSGKASEPPG